MRILVVKLTSLGDVIHTLPAITDAAKKVENIEVHWLVEEHFGVIPGWHPAVSQVFTAATRRWRKQPGKFLSETKRLKTRLAAQHYDFIIDAQGLLKSAVLSRYALGCKVGYDKHSIKEPLASRFYDLAYSVDKQEHAVTRTRQLFAQALNYPLPADLDYGIQAARFDHRPDSNYLVFLHGTTWSSKQWPLDKWRELVSLAAEHQYKVKLLWGNQEEHFRAQEIAENYSNALVCPKLNLDEIANLLSNAKAVVAVDTGLGHLAAALSIPCINLYGATDSRRTGTIGAFQKHLQAQFECSPCLLKNCNYKGESISVPACFDQFTAQLVWQQLEDLIEGVSD